MRSELIDNALQQRRLHLLFLCSVNLRASKIIAGQAQAGLLHLLNPYGHLRRWHWLLG